MTTLLPKRLSLLLTLVAAHLAGNTFAAAPAKIDYQRDVRPILSGTCFKCHGPDEGTRKGGLRLDLRDEALKPAKSGERAIVPGKIKESELITRVLTTDEDDVMPPPSAKHPLTDAQKEILKQWVAQGAEYQPHWSFIAPKQSPLPRVKDRKWSRNPIDNFILARLEQEKLKPSKEADRYTLIRRVYLDLIGLPPSPEQVDAFVKDKSPKAYEKVVDELLASPHYGERWARRWLDLARYADTNGYEKDRPRSIWPYRDWVINALNADMPFDEFTIEQIAGDMLPNATMDQLVATGFHRNTMLNEEGGIDPLEFRFYATVDRIATTGTTWLGLTIGCAQCHTHKYDPITHTEYYQMMSFLNNANEPDQDLPDTKIDQQRKDHAAKLATMVSGLAEKFPITNKAASDDRPAAIIREELIEKGFAEWLKVERNRTVGWQVLKPATLKANLALLTLQEDNSIFATGDQSKADTYELTYKLPKGTTALRLEAIPDKRLPAHGPGATFYEGPKGDFFLSEFTATANGQPLKFSDATHSFGKPGIGRGTATAKNCIDGDQQSGWSVNGGQGERHIAVFNFEKPLEADSEVKIAMLFEKHYAAPLGRFRLSATTASTKAEARDFAENIDSLLLKSDDALTKENRTALRQLYLLNAPELAAHRTEIDKLRRSEPDFPTTLVMRERPATNPRATFRYHRGEFLQPKEPVTPGVISVLHKLPADQKRDRLTFARWLVSTENPLVGRVTVNRHWAAFFGRGLVRTTEDFGLQGELPTHPALLDWLAVEFEKQGWSMKKLHRLIVTSATYRQDSTVTPQLLAKDAENKLLAHGPRVRLEAEQIRDSVLKVSGLLSSKLGGPSVYPPQPASVTSEGTYGKLSWTTSTGEDRYRRGLYTFTKRTAPYAMFNTFDAPSGEACVARRDVSNTPLQALTLLNDTVFLEAAQALGRDWAKETGSVETKLQKLFQRCLTRSATSEEITRLKNFYDTQRARLEAKELNATELSGNKDGTVEQAAWTIVARALINLDEMVTKQ
ncbi:MAG TPA: PSD1 and planctomycete cytochrome C domain-containing protein [Verrucomicrobiae bacterium]